MNNYQLDLFKITALCKFRGMLCLGEFNVLPEGEIGKCPECGCTTFTERHGWLECDGESKYGYLCDFAISADILKTINTQHNIL